MPIIEGSGRIRRATFTETTGPGTYTAAIAIPPNCAVKDVIVSNQALWTATTSATLNVGDAADSDGYFAAVSLKAAPAADVNGTGGISAFNKDTGSGAYAGFIKEYPSGGTITATVVTVGAAGNAGRTTLKVVLEPIGSSAAATKA